MQKLVDKNCKAAVIIMVMDTKENMLVIKKKRNLKKEMKTIRKNKMEILELKNTK